MDDEVFVGRLGAAIVDNSIRISLEENSLQKRLERRSRQFSDPSAQRLSDGACTMRNGDPRPKLAAWKTRYRGNLRINFEDFAALGDGRSDSRSLEPQSLQPHVQQGFGFRGRPGVARESHIADVTDVG